MSADNGLVLTRTRNLSDDRSYDVREYQGESPSQSIKTFETLEQAVKFAEQYCKEHVVEYGISFHLNIND